MKKIKKTFKSVGSGVIDAVFPSIHKTIKMEKSDLPDEKDKVQIDFIRLLTAVTVWILLILVAMDKIKLSDVLEFMQGIK
jgi:hypothetical protein